jgi:hypothetical protein
MVDNHIIEERIDLEREREREREKGGAEWDKEKK